MSPLQVAMMRARNIKAEAAPLPMAPDAVPEPVQAVREEPAYLPTHVRIQRIVADFYGVTRPDIINRCRKPKFVKPRWVAVWIVRQELRGHLNTLCRIGKLFNRDHTTIMHGIKRFEWMMANDPALKQQVSEIRELIANG